MMGAFVTSEQLKDRALRLTPRTYRTDVDEANVRRFLRGRQLWNPPSAYWRSGKSVMGIYLTLAQGNPSNHWFWEDARGHIHAYTWLIPEERAWRTQIHPEYWDETLVANIAAHAEEQLANCDCKSKVPAQPQSAAYVRDGEMISLLNTLGYVQGEAIDLYMLRPLDQAISSPQLKTGFRIRPIGSDDSVQKRVAVQYDAFDGLLAPPDRIITLTGRLIHFCVGEERATDLVVDDPGGHPVAFATIVLDQMTRLGEFDPVGTCHAHRRQGLGRALMLAGLARMRAAGMRYAVVRTGVDNHPAIALYRATGFSEVDQLYQYVKAD